MLVGRRRHRPEHRPARRARREQRPVAARPGCRRLGPRL